MGTIIPAAIDALAFLEEAEYTKYPISASQIKTAKCLRKWAFEYILGLRSPGGPAAEFGTRVHKIAEDFATKGAMPDRLTQEGNLFMAGLPFMGPPKSGVAEGAIDMVIDGVRYRGFIDLRGYQIPDYDPARRVVRDYKTSSNPKGVSPEGEPYGLWGRENFLKDPQAVIYGTYDVIEADDTESHLDWLYFWTRGKPRVEASRAVLTRAELEDAFEPVVHTKAKELVRLRIAAPDPNDLDPNTTVCNNFGGCPHRERCQLTTKQKIGGVLQLVTKSENRNKEKTEMTLLEKIAADRATKAALANGTPTTLKSVPPPAVDIVNPPEVKKAEPAAKLTGPKAVPQAEARPVTSGDAELGAAVRVILGAVAKAFRG